MSNYILEMDHVTKKFGNFTAVSDASIKLEPGKVYGLIGPNGAGKSTLMSMIMGLLFPTSGEGSIKGNKPGSKEALKLIGYSPEFTSFYTDMSALEYLCYMGTLSGLSFEEAKKRSLELIEQFELTESMNKKVAKFSTGMKKKVSLAQAMIHSPEILLLDEPTANLDPTARHEILETVRDLVKRENMTILISSHVLTELQTIVSDVIMLEKGKVVLASSVEEAQAMFNKGILIADCQDNTRLYEYLKDKTDVQITDDGLRINDDNPDVIKKEIVKFVYENDIVLNGLNQEKITLDSLYQKVLSGGNE